MSQAIGGQAVLEGVMMRGPRNWAVAVRKPDGEHRPRLALDRPADGAPLGAAAARSSAASSRSASRSRSASARCRSRRTTPRRRRPRATSEPAEIGRWALFFSFAVAIGFALTIFKVGPALLTDTLPISDGRWFVVVEGLVRVTVFVLYLFLLSLIPSLRRVFQYHAAEHKAINAYEAGEELDARDGAALLADPPALRHRVPALGDGDRRLRVRASSGKLPWYWLIVTRIAFLPLIAGIAYELIRFAGKHAAQPGADDPARAGPLAAKIDDARAGARPARGLDSRAP